MNEYHISSEPITLHTTRKICQPETTIGLSEDAKARILACRSYLDEKIKNQREPIYGVTTGFGALCNHVISHDELQTLQRNLVMSHACGMGDLVNVQIVRLMLFLKIQSLSYGYSGIHLPTVERLVDLFNHGIYPVIYEQGSLGASGDLSPLAHLSLPLLGLGEVYYQEKRVNASEVMQRFGWNPLILDSKEGLALLNGTQFMSAYGVFAIQKAYDLSCWADLIGALSFEVYDGRIEAFAPQVHHIRHQKGQIAVAGMFRKILKESKNMRQEKKHVQDPYSFRCIPQVHGASLDAINYVAGVFEREINAVTDNPTLFPDDDLIISAGNFHGQPLALSLDFLGLSLAELGNISERRVYRLISGERNMPSFLVVNPGLNSGFMIPQYTAASIVSQNKQLCTPASVDSIESSQGQEDHVSMGANAAVKTLKIVENLEKLLAIELMCACQAMGFRDYRKTSPILKKLYTEFSSCVPFVENDRLMYVEMEKSRQFIRNNNPASYLV
jgi:histidine ammonia-lyase